MFFYKVNSLCAQRCATWISGRDVFHPFGRALDRLTDCRLHVANEPHPCPDCRDHLTAMRVLDLDQRGGRLHGNARWNARRPLDLLTAGIVFILAVVAGFPILAVVAGSPILERIMDILAVVADVMVAASHAAAACAACAACAGTPVVISK